MKKFILGIIIGGIIFGTSVYALTSYLYSANEVSYSPSDSDWNVDSVDKAIDDLYTRTTTMMPIPTATKTITSNGSNIDVKDYAKVNVNVAGISGTPSIISSTTGSAGGNTVCNSNYCVSASSTLSTPSISVSENTITITQLETFLGTASGGLQAEGSRTIKTVIEIK